MADDIEQFIQEHRLEKVSLIGHSMGAKVAMTVALRSPSLLRALIPVDNSPINANLNSDFYKYVQGMREIEGKQDSAIRQFLLTNLVRSPNTHVLCLRIPINTIAANLDNMGDFPFKDPEEVRFDGPTLIIRGIRSHYVANEFLPLIGRFFPIFVLRDIESGHWVISEKPEAFKRAVVEFMLENDA
ncbi:MAG: hypothetical protein Q9164_003033 [Protoblastenia rupestris]